MFQDGVNRVVHDIQKDLLELVWVGGGDGEIPRQVQVDTDVVHTQVIITQRQRLFESLVNLHLNTLRLVLAGETQEILHDAVGALCLLVKFVGILDSLLPHLSAGSQQLAVAEDGGKRVVQFVRDAGDQLTDRRQFLAVEQLLLGAAQVFVGLASFFIENRALDGAGNLAADGDEQVHVSRRKLPRGEAADDAILGPQNDDIRRKKLLSCLDVAENLRQCQALYGKESRVHSLNVLHQFRFHGDGRKMP